MARNPSSFQTAKNRCLRLPRGEKPPPDAIPTLRNAPDFSFLDKFDVELADYLLENPEETILDEELYQRMGQKNYDRRYLLLKFYRHLL
jgi:hypothetical protein